MNTYLVIGYLKTRACEYEQKESIAAANVEDAKQAYIDKYVNSVIYKDVLTGYVKQVYQLVFTI